MPQEIVNFDVLGIPIAATNLEKTAQLLLDWSQDSKGRYVGVREVASIMKMYSDPALLKVTREAAINIPDGMPLVWIGRRNGYEMARTCGADLMEKMLRESAVSGLKHFFYGGKEGVADGLADTYRRQVSGLQIVGTYCPPFRPLTKEEDEAVIKTILASKADIVWVGISSPAQDVWMQAHVAQLPQTLIGVGAAFDFLSGEVARAPLWMQKNGLEWLHRLISEPRRLWRRYILLAPKFAFLVLSKRLMKKQ